MFADVLQSDFTLIRVNRVQLWSTSPILLRAFAVGFNAKVAGKCFDGILRSDKTCPSPQLSEGTFMKISGFDRWLLLLFSRSFLPKAMPSISLRNPGGERRQCFENSTAPKLN
jgi:hypothetical protein